ncbi:MAG: hypothetical protein ACI86M_000801 [Saprospiraceae bacterium]
MRRSHKKMFLHKNALSQKRSEYRPLGLKNFGECSIRLRWGSQNLGSFLLRTQKNVEMENQIDEMQRLLNNELPGLGYVIWTVFIGLLVGLAYGLIKRILLPVLGQGRKGRQWHWRLEIIERLYLPVLVLAVLVSILVSRPLVGVVVTTILVLVLYRPMKNYVLGVIHHAGNIYSIGQIISVSGQHGSIHSFNALSLEMELDDGSMLDIPYAIFSNAIVVRSSPKSGVLVTALNFRSQNHVILLK